MRLELQSEQDRHNELCFPFLTLLALCRSGCPGYLPGPRGNCLQCTAPPSHKNSTWCLSVAHLSAISIFAHKRVGLAGAVSARRLCTVLGLIKGVTVSWGQNWVRLGRIFTHVEVDKIRILSPRVRARLETSAGCHHVWFQMHDCNSTRQRCVFPKASQAICRGVYRSWACLWYMPSTTHTRHIRYPFECKL